MVPLAWAPSPVTSSTSSAGPSLTVPPSGGVDNGSNGYSIVQSLSGTTATLDGGVYPNGSATTVWWEYGTSSATDGGTDFTSASSTSSESLGAGTAPVATTPIGDHRPRRGRHLLRRGVRSQQQRKRHNLRQCDGVHDGVGPGRQWRGHDHCVVPGDGGQLSLSSVPAWTSGATLTYQWQESSDGSNWNNLSGATASATTYTLQPSDSQQYLRLQVTAANGSGTTTDDSNILQAQLFAPSASGSAVITDTNLGLGGVLSISSSPSWSGASSVTDQWQESSDRATWSNISGANSSAYAIAPSDSQKYIRLAVIASNAGGSTTVTSNSVQVEDLTPVGSGGGGSGSGGSGGGGPGRTVVISSPPILSGGASVGDTITVRGGSYENAGAVTLTFERCARTCAVVQSGSSTSYRLRASDAGYYLVTIVKVASIAPTASATTRCNRHDRAGALLEGRGAADHQRARDPEERHKEGAAAGQAHNEKAEGEGHAEHRRADTHPRRERQWQAPGLGVRAGRQQAGLVLATTERAAYRNDQDEGSNRRPGRTDRRHLTLV